jgi:hypothetical protein
MAEKEQFSMIETAVEVLCEAPLHRETEFDIITYGIRRMGGCGMAGLASAASSATGTIYHPIDVYTIAYLRGWCDISGAITPYNLWRTALAMGLHVAAFRDYGEPWPDWQSWCEEQLSAGNPIVVETARGQALVDLISGSGENANNLQYHYYAKLGRNRGGASSLVNYTLPAGWWCADGDNFAGGNNYLNGFNAKNILQYYEDYRVANAQLCAGIALVGRQATKMAWTKQSDGRGLDSQGHTCGEGFMTELSSSGDAAHDGLLGETYFPDGKESFLPLSNGQVYTYDGAVHTGQGAWVSVKLWDLLQEKALVPVVQPLSPGQAADLVAMAAIRQALKANS